MKEVVSAFCRIFAEQKGKNNQKEYKNEEDSQSHLPGPSAVSGWTATLGSRAPSH